MVVQYNMFGDEEVTDLDGQVADREEGGAQMGLSVHADHLFLPEEVPEARDGRRGRCGGDAGRFRQGDVPGHVPVGQGKGL